MTPKRRRAQQRDVDLLEPDEAAALCRRLSRTGIADLDSIRMLAERGMLSEQPGNAAAMQKYARAAAEGRRVRYGILRIRPLDVDPELEAAVEEIFE